MKDVLIIEAQMKQYCAPFFALLNDALRADGIRLTVAYSDPPPCEAGKKDNCELPPEYGLKVNGSWLWPDRLLYQPLLKAALTSDMVIVEQANRLVLNHLLLPLSRAGLLRVAFWGHENRKADRIRLSEWYRRKTLNWVSWWFACTKGTAKYCEAHGVPATKITVFQNAVDTRSIQEQVQSLTAQDRAAVRGTLGIPVSAPVGIFCGRLEELKRVPFLVESSRIIKTRIPMFHLIIVGGGPEQDAVLQLIEGLDWVHWVGPRFGKEKAEFLAASDVFLLPGAVGLAIMDAFAAGLPMLTTRHKIHGDEIEYLEEGVNGLMSGPSPAAFAEAVSSVLNEPQLFNQLRAGAAASSGKYSVENMAENFRTGIRSCLDLPARSASFFGFQRAS